jgi:type IV pilus assembly protein PilA
MKSFFTSLKRQNGFTLVELMVVVAIIGLLSAVAIPNFKRYQAKAKISEAKLQLSASYMAEQAFFSDFNTYANCLSYMGFNPTSERNARYFSIGFDSSGSTNPASTDQSWIAAVNSGMQDVATTGCRGAAAGGADGVSWFSAGKGVGSAVMSAIGSHEASTTLAVLGAQNDTATMTFIITAAGIISGDNATNGTSAALSINEGKVISVLRQGY